MEVEACDPFERDLEFKLFQLQVVFISFDTLIRDLNCLQISVESDADLLNFLKFQSALVIFLLRFLARFISF